MAIKLPKEERLIASAPKLFELLKRITQAAFVREITMGDICSYLEAKAELRAATKEAQNEIHKLMEDSK